MDGDDPREGNGKPPLVRLDPRLDVNGSTTTRCGYVNLSVLEVFREVNHIKHEAAKQLQCQQ